jgi:hypothetical protein
VVQQDITYPQAVLKWPAKVIIYFENKKVLLLVLRYQIPGNMVTLLNGLVGWCDNFEFRVLISRGYY